MGHRYRKTNAENCIELLSWCFGGSPERSAAAALVSMALFCLGFPTLLDAQRSKVLSSLFHNISEGSFYVALA
jgi:hypothetical protein